MVATIEQTTGMPESLRPLVQPQAEVVPHVTAPPEAIRVLSVDDNPDVGEALRLKFQRTPGFTWLGWLSDANTLVERVLIDKPAIVLLDIDMPNKDPFVALAELSEKSPLTRVIVFSGYVKGDYIERAIEAGAWGYASKNDGEEELLSVIRQVVAGGFALSTSVRREFTSL